MSSWPFRVICLISIGAMLYGAHTGDIRGDIAGIFVFIALGLFVASEIERWRDKVPAISMEEAVKDKPMPLCGDKVRHYTLKWNGAQCMECRSISVQQEEEAKEERMARLIASEVVKEMKKERI